MARHHFASIINFLAWNFRGIYIFLQHTLGNWFLEYPLLNSDLSTLTVLPCVTRFHCLSHGRMLASSFLMVLQILRGFSQTHSFYENKHRQYIEMLLKDTFLVWLTKMKQTVAILLLWALLFIILVKTHIDKPFQCK